MTANTHRQAVVESGSQVRVRVGGREEDWSVVAPFDADPLHGLISAESPLGFALLGHAQGETVSVRGPQPYEATILDVH